MRKLKLKKWVLVTLRIILIVVALYVLVSLFTKKTVVITESENYTCYGSFILQVCSGESYE